MPVYVPALSSKRSAKRRQRFVDSYEEQNRVDIDSFVRACDKAAGKVDEKVKTESHVPSTTTHSKVPQVTFMDDTVDSQNLPLSHNSPSINQPGSASPTNRNKDQVPSGTEKSFKRRRSFSKSVNIKIFFEMFTKDNLILRKVHVVFVYQEI